MGRDATSWYLRSRSQVFQNNIVLLRSNNINNDLYKIDRISEYNSPSFFNIYITHVLSLCEYDLALLMGPSVELNTSKIPYYMTYEPNPTSNKNIWHWIQG